MLSAHFQLKNPIKLQKTWFLAAEDKVEFLSKTSEPICLSPSHPKENNVVFEDENVGLGVLKKNWVSEESRLCPCKKSK